ncbi:hypothetical protein HNR62_000296 [Oceanisphaera litoralis]|uniref:phage adaptor protein n=1 Tax=Oceanisphaera litoralis TaxID=225144 RepID=UPI00195B4F92|nr:DUF6682 family protein [Oceanisphaera litoralis]MBM7454467.1 hypothetical protein [Oceanisphaera litoralis]
MPVGTITANDVFRSVRELLGDKDPGGLQWLDAELVDWLNEGCLEITRLRPEASSDTVTAALAAGTQQALPTDGMVMLTVEHNGAPANPGRVCKIIPRKQLDSVMPDWHGHTRDAAVTWVMVSDANPRVFWVYPPNTGTGQVTYTYTKYPAKIDQLTDNVPLPDTYKAVLVDYICYRAYQKQLESQEAKQRAIDHRQLFEAAVGATSATFSERGANARAQAGGV